MRSLLLILAISALQMRVDSLCDLGYEYELQGNYAEAIRLNQEALDLTPTDSLEWISIICNTLSVDYFYTGEYEKATELGYRALRADEQRNDSVGISSSLNQIAVVFQQLGQYDQAIAIEERAIAIEEALIQSGSAGDHRMLLSDRLGILSEILSKAGRGQEALPYSQRAIDLARAIRNPRKLGIRLCQLGSIYVNLGKYQQALPILREAIELLEQNQVTRSVILALPPYSQALDHTGHHTEAIEAMQRCLQLTYITGQREARLHALHELTYMHQTPEALPYFQHFVRLRDSIYSDQMQENIAEMEVSYETEKKDNEILRQQAIVQRQQMQIVFACVVLVLLIIIVLLIALYARRKRQESEEKNRMVSILSHDLKSPALAQQRVLRLLSDGTLHATPDILTALTEAQDKQVELVLNMLDYARLEAGRIHLEPIHVDMESLTEDVFALLQEQAQQKGVRLTRTRTRTRTQTTTTTIYTDRTLTATIMRNLLSNAIRFSPEGGIVEVELFDHGFRVIDHGCGFGNDPSKHGTGLGLNICRRFAKMLNATLKISETEGGGTTICLIFEKK